MYVLTFNVGKRRYLFILPIAYWRLFYGYQLLAISRQQETPGGMLFRSANTLSDKGFYFVFCW